MPMTQESVTRPPLFVELPDELWEFRGSTFEEHVDCWQEIDGQVQSDKWKLGAVAASLEVKYDEKTIDRFAHETRRSPRRIREYAQTYRVFQNGARAPILSFSHHVKAASAEDPILAIQKAEDGEWSVHELERWIRTGLEPDQKPEKKKGDEDLKVLQDEAVKAWLEADIKYQREQEPNVPLHASFLRQMIHSRIGQAQWQLARTIESDCNIVREAVQELLGSADQVSKWLRDRNYFMSNEDVAARLKTLIDQGRIEEIEEQGRKAGQKGGMKKVYLPLRNPLDVDEDFEQEAD